MIEGLKETIGILKTKIISDDTKEHVYEICREFDTDGEEIILVTLFPVLSSPAFDRSSQGILNHAFDKKLRLKKIRFVFMFSKVSGSKISARELKEVDSRNMNYIRDVIANNPNAKIIVSFGVSLIKNATLLKAKVSMMN